MSHSLSISHPTGKLSGTIALPGSKSESNRWLIINALSGFQQHVTNLSNAEDVSLLATALKSNDHELFIGNSGTGLRFLIAYCALCGHHKIIKGSPRLHERQVASLVDALKQMGAKINYLEKEGYAPIEIMPSDLKSDGKMSIDASISSQFISALLLIAPYLEHGLEIELEGKVSSLPYIDLTLNMMSYYGVVCSRIERSIVVQPGNYVTKDINIGSDWSNAAPWYCMMAMADDSAIFLEGLKRDSMQGDMIVSDLFRSFGVITEFTDTGAFITNNGAKTTFPKNIDFTYFPDLAQCVIVFCAANSIQSTFSGLESLRIKETDRIAALQSELRKIGLVLSDNGHGTFALSGDLNLKSIENIDTWNDHRMVMAFVSLALKSGGLTLLKPDNVNKSYPDFIEHLSLTGFDLKYR